MQYDEKCGNCFNCNYIYSQACSKAGMSAAATVKTSDQNDLRRLLRLDLLTQMPRLKAPKSRCPICPTASKASMFCRLNLRLSLGDGHAAFSAQLFANDQLETGPDFVDSADLDVHERQWQGQLADSVFRDRDGTLDDFFGQETQMLASGLSVRRAVTRNFASFSLSTSKT